MLGHGRRACDHFRAYMPAAWSYYTATHSILGLRPELNGLRIDPCLPPEWSGFTMERSFRGKPAPSAAVPTGKSPLRN